MKQLATGFEQSDALRDHVFPLFKIPSSTDFASPTFLGTGFFIGKASYALTAAHVVKDAANVVAALAGPTGWEFFKIARSELHPREDIAVLLVQDPADG